MSSKRTVDLFSVEDSKTFSCRISGGKLVPALHYAVKSSSSKVTDTILFAGYFRATDYFFLCTSSGVYASPGGNTFTLISSLEGDSPFMVEDVADGKPRAVIIKGANAVYSSDRINGVYYNYGANLSCGIMHCGRLFGADANDGYKLCWSGEGGLRDWAQGLNGSGSLTLDSARGKILNLVEFGGKLIAVREFGLTVFSMFGSPENFSAEITDTDTDVIYKNTAQAVGGKLIFYTQSGLHSYDGSVIKPLRHRLEKSISGPVSSAEFDGKYFLACLYARRKSVFCYDTVDGESYIIRLGSDAVCAADKVYVFNPNSVSYLEVTGGYMFTSGNINFGSGRRKTVTQICVDGEADIEIYNGKIRCYYTSVKGVMRTNLRGESFTVTVSGKTPVNSITLTAEECDAI